LKAVGRIDWSRGLVDSSHIRVPQGSLAGPSPVDRASTGSKHHLLVDAAGVPLLVTLTGGNRNDITQLQDRPSTPAARPDRCRPRLRPRQLPARATALRRQTEHRSARNRAWYLPYSRLRAYLPAIPQEVFEFVLRPDDERCHARV
jgi:hypothetical protein